ncbi:two-component sensor histidine kinase [Virgisporangium aurantiacum]|uniref:histidine kinase n=2 Tax=Virgisporangium aurantiacum TaxID=175570 RepID=A0A8J3ZD65_9ACTN|nr:two-component sensor histidine kinase [Virgisporangium aurantiacum]
MPVMERLAAMRRRFEALPPIVVDVVLAVVCFLATVTGPVKFSHHPGWLTMGLAAVTAVPLVWRRRAPVLVTALVAVGTLGLTVTRAIQAIPMPYGQVVATYTVAAVAPPIWRWTVLGVTAALTVLSVLVLFEQRPSTLALAGLPFVVAYALGVSTRARRNRIAMLEERSRRLTESAAATAVRERERIAREIHDIVAHSVSLMVVQAEAGLVQAGDPDRAADKFETISGTGREALAQLDRALGVLRANGDEGTRQPQPGLADLPALVERARQAGVAGELTEDGHPRPIPADLAAAVYRVTQEAVTNAIRHAHARHLWVCLSWRPAALAITVDDDGRGPTAAPPAGGHGLIGMRERVDAFGGALTTGARPGGAGFRVAAVLPLNGDGRG